MIRTYYEERGIGISKNGNDNKRSRNEGKRKTEKKVVEYH